ncbi:MAG: beta-lactamase regulating signal transducer with metallopeptidase domain [Candidatus Binatia bacterium]|jgi:beta-lactamase regulating signal transducer with metallopeptidase domain
MNSAEFLNILGRSSVQAGALVALVLLAQALWGARISPRWRSAMWLLVVLRLLLPVSISSTISIFNLLPRWSASMSTSPIPTEPPTLATPGDQPLLDVDPAPEFAAIHAESAPPFPELESFAPPIETFPMDAREPEGMEMSAGAPIGIIPSPPVAAPMPTPVETRSISLSAGLFALWLSIVLLLAARTALGALRMRTEIRKSRELHDPDVLAILDDCRRRLGVRSSPIVAESELRSSPAIYGLFRPQILLPCDFIRHFSTEELRFVLLHELAHVKRRDLLVNWITLILQCVHWFNPLVWLAFHRWRTDRELACDEMALEAAGEGQNLPYGETILRLLEKATDCPASPGMVGILEDKRQLKKRLQMIGAFVPAKRASLTALILLTAIGAVSLTDARNQAESQPSPSASNIATPGGAQVSVDATATAAPQLETGYVLHQAPTPTRRVITNGPTLKVTVLDDASDRPIENAEILTWIPTPPRRHQRRERPPMDDRRGRRGVNSPGSTVLRSPHPTNGF